jgi:hypothetical protein
MTDVEAQDTWDAVEDPSREHHDRLDRVEGL